MAFDFPPELQTKADAGIVLRDIDTLLDSLYKTEKGGDITQITTDLTKNMPEGREDRKRFLNELRSSVLNLQAIKLTLAFQPTRAQSKTIVEWLRKNYSSDVLVEFSYEPGVIAGAIIEYAGKYADMSASKKLDALEKAYESI